jgi:hypothetical protein
MADAYHSKLAREQLVPGQIVEGGEELAAGKVAGGAEDDHDAGVSRAGGPFLLPCRHYLGMSHFFAFASVGAGVLARAWTVFTP